jgi:hypothetical protein
MKLVGSVEQTNRDVCKEHAGYAMNTVADFAESPAHLAVKTLSWWST